MYINNFILLLFFVISSFWIGPIYAYTSYICTDEKKNSYDFSKEDEVALESLCKISNAEYRNNLKKCCIPQKCLSKEDKIFSKDYDLSCEKDTFPYNLKIIDKGEKRPPLTMCVNMRPWVKRICIQHHECNPKRAVMCTREYIPHICKYGETVVSGTNKCNAKASLRRTLCVGKKEIYIDIGRIECINKRNMRDEV